MNISKLTNYGKLSVYGGGHASSPSYYRSRQYFDKLEGISVEYHTIANIQRRFMPISQKPLYIKAYAYLCSVLVIFFALIKDYFNPPKAIVICRKLVVKYSPYPVRLLIGLIAKKGVPIYWDFDDPILHIGEICKKEFNLLSKIATSITVTHEGLRNTIAKECRNKVELLPTTDGDIYKLYDSRVNEKRLQSLNREVRMIWVATNVNLYHLEFVAEDLDKAAYELKKATGKQLVLNVVCNGDLIYDFKYLKLNNIKWTREEAIKQMVEAHIGIMPLINTEAARGKGGFKLIQYQSIGLPSIASNVGFNNTVLSEGTGYLVDNENHNGWSKAVIILSTPDEWGTSSKAAFENWLSNFSYDKNLEFWKKKILI